MRSSLSITVLAAAAAASLFSTQGLAAQVTPQAVRPSAESPAVAESEMAPDDAVNMRRLVNEEARHRDRAARLARLRALAEQSGKAERLAAIDRLERLESDRFEARTLTARSRMSEHALRQADDFVRRGGVLKMRRSNQGANEAAQRAARPGSNSSVERTTTQRKVTTKPRSAPAPKASRSGTSSSGGRKSGGRSPR